MDLQTFGVNGLERDRVKAARLKGGGAVVTRSCGRTEDKASTRPQPGAPRIARHESPAARSPDNKGIGRRLDDLEQI